QFDLLRSRLETEYGAPSTLQRLAFRFARWVSGPPAAIQAIRQPGQSRLMEDAQGNSVMLFTATWELDMSVKEAEDVEFSEIPVR
ncbi:MAG TPA: peptide chain release factor 3, partial [Thermoanaerobaculia bacterium]|nr:peptide chain release factor 3 [Thermoanaerobaculia bacterium]